MKYRLSVPALFWDDHFDRKPCDGDPEQYIAREVGRIGRHVLIEATQLQLATLWDDAKFYTDKDGPTAHAENRWLRKPALDTLAALRHARDTGPTEE